MIELYDEMSATPVAPDLVQLWQRLDVKLSLDVVEFDDEIAACRRASGHNHAHRGMTKEDKGRHEQARQTRLHSKRQERL